MKTINHKFVEFIPEEIEDGYLYISVIYKSAVHNCICGCGNRVVTPITPTDWRLTLMVKVLVYFHLLVIGVLIVNRITG